MRRQLSIQPYCTNCKQHCLFTFWSDTFPESGQIMVICPKCKMEQFVIELKMKIGLKERSLLDEIMNRGVKD